MTDIQRNRSSVIYKLSTDEYIEFQLHIPLVESYKWIGTNGFFFTPKTRLIIFKEDYLLEAVTELLKSLEIVFSFKDPIKPDLFEKGIGYYENLRTYHRPDDYPSPGFYEKFLKEYPEPSLSNQSLKVWSTPDGPENAETWLYAHNNIVYLEVGQLYDWQECDEQDNLNFDKYIASYRFYRYEITTAKALEYYEQTVRVLSYLLPPEEFPSYAKKPENFKLLLESTER